MSSEQISPRDAFAAYQRRSEFLVASTKLVVMVLLLALYLSPFSSADSSRLQQVLTISTAYGVWLVAMLALVTRHQKPPALIWASIAVDFTALYALMWALPPRNDPTEFYALAQPAQYFLFVLIALRVLRFEARYVFGAGAAAVFGWVILLSYTIEGPSQSGFWSHSGGDDLNLAMVLGAQVEKIIIITVFTTVLAITAIRAKALLFRERGAAEQARAHQVSLEQAAITDEVSGLPNRIAAPAIVAGFGVSMVGLIAIKLQEKERMSATFGHIFWDSLARSVSQRLTQYWQGRGRVIRLDDDTFLLAHNGSARPATLQKLANDLAVQFEKPFEIGQREVLQRIRIGVSTWYDTKDVIEAIFEAQSATFHVPENASPPVAIFNDTMRQRGLQFSEIESRLREALASPGAITPHFQPIIDAKSRQLIGFEALARWTRANGRHVKPIDFIPVAEATGLIIPLGQLILEAACHAITVFNSEIPSEKQLTVSVNLSVRELNSPYIVSDISRILSQTLCSPKMLKLEVTESATAKDLDDLKDKLTELRLLGVEIAIDDFGTGYSSLSYLKDLPVTSLKIDRSFISDIADPGHAALVKTIVDIARSFGLTTVAEGVETTDMQDRVIELGVDQIQGYLFSEPLPGQEVLDRFGEPSGQEVDVHPPLTASA